MQPRSFLLATTGTLPAALLAALLAAPAAAQCTGFQSGSATLRNSTWTQLSLPSTASLGTASANFTADAPNQADIVDEIAFLYRLAGDAREMLLSTENNQCIVASWPGGDRGTLEWTDVDGRGLIRVRQEFQATSLSPTSGCATIRATVTNLSAGPITLNLYAYCDIDQCGVENNLAVSDNATNTKHRVQNPFCGSLSTVEGVGADRWEADRTTGLRSRLVDGTAADLGNTGLGLFGDYHGAFQWKDRVIAAGQSATYTVQVCHNPGLCGSRAASTSYGSALAGTHGVATLATTAPPILGRTASIAVANAPPFTTGLLLIGFGRANLQIGSTTFLTQPVVAPQLVVDVQGAGAMSIGIPNSVDLCGGLVNLQFVFVDAIVPGPLPIAHSDGLEWTLGT